MSFGQKIAYLRTNKEISQNTLAELLNVARSSISLYETDSREPTKDTIIKISKFFNVSVDYLIDDETPINFKTSINYYEKEFGPLKNLTEEDIQLVKNLVDHLNMKNSK